MKQRLTNHVKGYNKTTKPYLPLQLIHVDICKNRYQARLLEKFFKTGYGREVIREISLLF